MESWTPEIPIKILGYEAGQILLDGSLTNAEKVLKIGQLAYQKGEYKNAELLEWFAKTIGASANTDEGAIVILLGLSRIYPLATLLFLNSSALTQYCFAAGTPILMSDGTYKPIEQIKIGDEVMAFDGLGELQPRKVTQTFITPDQEVVQLGNIKVTLGHHFLQPDGSFKALDEIDNNGFLVGVTGKLIPHPGIKPVAGKHTVYNFTVEDLHTYIAGDYRVHNESLSLYQPVTTGGLIGASIGSQIGSYFANDKFASQLVAQSLGKTVGSWVGDAIVYEFNLSDDPAFLNRSQQSLSLGAIYKRLPGSVISTGINLGSSKLASSLIKTFKIEDPLSQIGFSVLVSTTISYEITRQVALSSPAIAVKFFGAPPLVNAATGNVITNAVGEPLVDFSQLNLTASLANAASSAFGSFAGSYLYQKLIAWNVLSENVSLKGATLGATVGAFAGSLIPGIGTAVGAFVGSFLGNLIGGWFGDKDYPRAYGSILIVNNQFVITPIEVADKGNYNIGYNMAVAARDSLIVLAAAIGGKALSIRNFRYGHFENSYIYRPQDIGLSAYNYPYRFSSPQEAIVNGVLQSIKSLQMEGGDLYIKRYLLNLPGDVNTLDKLNAGFEIAREWGVYKDNPYLYDKTIQELDDNAISIADQQILALRQSPANAPVLTNPENKFVDFDVNVLPSQVSVSIAGSNFIINGRTVTPDQVVRFADGSRFKPVIRNGAVTLEAEQVANWLNIKPKALALNLDAPQVSDTYIGANASKIVSSNFVGSSSLISRNLPQSNYTASSTYNGSFLPYKAFDGNLGTNWNGGGYATKWIEIDLGQKYDLDSISLVVGQSPAGNTIHEIRFSNQSIGAVANGASLATTLKGYTSSGQQLNYAFADPLTIGRYVQIKTVASPSWVAWIDIDIYGTPIVGGDVGNDVLVARVSGQILAGDQGDDVYIYSRGMGTITIVDSGGFDTIELDASIKVSDLLVEQQGNDLIIAIKDSNNPSIAISQLTNKIILKNYIFIDQQVEVIRLGSNQGKNSGKRLDRREKRCRLGKR